MPETPREDGVLTPRTRVRRLSIGVANFVRQLSEVDGHNADGSLTHRGVEQNFYREPIGVKDKPPTDAEVLICPGVILVILCLFLCTVLCVPLSAPCTAAV